MKHIFNGWLIAMLLLLFGELTQVSGQSQSVDPGCFFVANGDTVPASAFLSFGSGVKLKSLSRRMKVTIGQPVVGTALGDNFNSYYGYWTGFLVAPLPPMVTATQGDLLDRIQISWSPDPLGSFPVGGYKIFRDGVYLAAVDNNTRNYNDFNVIAGRPYNYEVRGINAYGEGSGGKALGFQVPNGVVTGWIRTPSGNPVPNALVTLMPMQGFSAKFGQFDGAFAQPDTSTNGNFLPLADSDWSITFWVKTSSSPANATFLQIKPIPFNIQLGTNGSVQVQANGTTLQGNFTQSASGWRHVALSYSDGTYNLYLDGVLADLQTGAAILQSTNLSIGARTSNPGWEGKLDELRIYHKRLDELDLADVMEGTASTLTLGLKYYWKMDEERGTKSFDVFNRTKLYFCGSIFDKDRPPVRTSGQSNEEGYYRIESASYGTGTTFLAEPMKNFYKHRALKFTRANESYATLPDFSLTPKSTLELWVRSSGPDGIQTLVSKRWPGGNNLQVQLIPNGTSNEIIFKLNNQAQNFGVLGIDYRHLAFTLDSTGSGTAVSAYRDGVLLGSAVMPAFSGAAVDTSEPWVLGARKSGTDFLDFYGGLIDEFAVYDTTLSNSKILEHKQNSRDIQERGLRVYYACDEGSGSLLNNAGSLLIDKNGRTYNTGWTNMSPNQSTTPHEFSPNTRQVTLNPSVTSVDQVDFVDRSTIPVSGFVRYQNTDCFARSVEILVNGESYNPRIYTDTTGKFTIDLEPGATVYLSPKYEDHAFLPASWQVFNVTSPIAGILFNDITTRKVSGSVAGGQCKLPIIQNPSKPSGTKCILKVRTIDGCFEKLFEFGVLDTAETVQYEFEKLPPLQMTVSVVEFSDPTIKTFFQVQGGTQIDMRTKKDTIIDFIYFSPPQPEIVSGLDPISDTCSIIVLNQGIAYTVGIKVQEYYLGQACPLDTANIRIINDFAGIVVDTTLSNGLLLYKFVAGNPVPTPPFLQNFQIIATSIEGNESSLTKQGLVTGIRAKSNTFTTQLPEVPLLVLRDPPGDKSYSFLEKEQQVCHSITTNLEIETGIVAGVEIDLKPEIMLVAAPLGIGKINVAGGGPVINIDGEVTYKFSSENAIEMCTSFKERIATGADELIVGPSDSIPYLTDPSGATAPYANGWVQGGDLFMGAGLNVEFGFVDVVTFNDTICAGEVKSRVSISPKNFATTYLYSEYYIRNNVIRYLDAIIQDPGVDQGKRDTCLQSKSSWLKILNDNKAQIKAAKFRKNLSYDGNIEYEYSETSDTTKTSSTENSGGVSLDASVTLGFKFDGVGVDATVGFKFATMGGRKDENKKQTGITTGYVLGDNDPGDAFTVDIAMDSVYKTPVFRTVTGQSSCPWEPKTAHREGNTLEFRDGSGAVAVDVPANEPAVFKFTLGNKSETNETWTYAFTAGPESNPDGAKIFLNGAALDHPVFYAIPYGESVPITVTLERGPEEYDYDSLEIVLYSLCEDERANALGILPDADTVLYSAQYISAHFIRPCSEVDINVPQQDWVIFPDPITSGSDDIMRITVSGYSKSVDEFDKVRVQYRRSDGDGAWINIVPPVDPFINATQPGAEIEKSDLGNIFTQFYWNTLGLSDGPYEIRAVAVCSGDASDKPGYSQVIKGRIERQPPSLIGTPEPSDGVYNVGDEISFSFNKSVNCSKINALDNVLLFDATTDTPIDIDITCYENKIILDPNFQNKFFENRILRAELRDIEDKIGNKLKSAQWEFYVDRNELAWLTDSLGMTKFEDETQTVTASIQNRGGYPVPFTLKNIPDWVHVVPNQGTLAPNEIRPISFTIDSSLAFGLWSDSIVLHTETGQNPFFMGGDEGLPFGVRVVCRPPNWTLNANLFENSENMVLELNIQGEISTDVEDMVVAYIGDTLCGRAKVRYVPQVDKYLAYLTIYGNPNHVLAPLRLEIWDASACLRYSVVEDDFLFQPDDVLGDPLAPLVIHTSNNVLRAVPLGFGWNWLSFNLAFPNPNVDSALISLNYPANDLLKGQNAFSVYFNGGGWLGTLETLDNKTMYIYRADQPDTLQMLGNVLNPASTPIPLVAGWNWIGYIPNYALPINQALSSVVAQTGDLIKSQVAFAQYINPAFGWIGNLQYMQPPNGYQIKLSVPGTLTYPPPSTNRSINPGQTLQTAPIKTLDRGAPTSSFWTVDPTKFEKSMTLIGMLRVNGSNATSSTMELGVFAGTEIRGTATAIYIAPLQSYLFFLTTYSNTGGEQLRFKLFDSSTGTVQVLNEVMYFSPDLHQGSIEAPVPFTMGITGTDEIQSEQAFEVQPNPFSTETLLRFVLPKAQEVRISVLNINGALVSFVQANASEGLNTLRWKAQSETGTPLSSGVYFIRLETAAGSVIRKVILQK